MYALKLSLCATLIVAGAGNLRAQADLVIFDEDDPIGVGYYDASFGFTTGGSQLTATGPGNDKLIVLTDRAMTGTASGLLEWQSAAGGNWMMFVASPGWQTRDATGYSNLVLHLNGPAAIHADQLPRVGLESSRNQRTPWVELGLYLPEGVDADDATWQRVEIPLDHFEPYGQFALSEFKDVFFAQGLVDPNARTIWLDNVRLVADGSNPNDPPAAPTGVVVRSGDRSAVLHWDRADTPNIAGYRVYRALGQEDLFVALNTTPVSSPSFADVTVENGSLYRYHVRAVNTIALESEPSTTMSALPAPFADDEAFLEYVQQTAFDFFWYEANPVNGLVRDRSQPFSVVSMAATGFGLTGIGVAIDHGWITRAAGRDRVHTTLTTLWEKPQGAQPTGRIGHRGWFYHFVDTANAARAGTSEVSSIDTAWLLAGVIFAREYFTGDGRVETAIRDLANAILDRVDWLWMANGGDSLAHGWTPEGRFITYRWIGYNEAMLLYLIGMGDGDLPLPPVHWDSWVSGYTWETHYDQSYVVFPPLFGHQYSHCWVDFRHVADAYMNARGMTYFENSRRAALAQRAYCLDNPGGFAGYSGMVWGLTACDGPGSAGFFSYIARGAPPAQNDDGTIAPTAAGSALPFTPEFSLPTLRHLYDAYRERIWTGYGFRDAFNLQADWWGPDVLGIDQGPLLLMIENYRSQRVWQTFMQAPEIQRGLAAAGFVRLPTARGRLEPEPTGGMRLEWDSDSGRSYQVEYSPDLLRWFLSPTGFKTDTGGAGTLQWEDTGPPATDTSPQAVSHRFYRIYEFGTP